MYRPSTNEKAGMEAARIEVDRLVIDAAEAFLSSLDGSLATQAVMPFSDSEERLSWAYFPREMAGSTYAGVALFELDVAQRKLLHSLLSTSLSSTAYAQLNVIMILESILDVEEGFRQSPYRDPARYWISFFDEPDPVAPWSFRFEGHHVSIHMTMLEGRVVASTPLFLGANPAEFAVGEHTRLRPCGDEEDAARELLSCLDVDLRRVAVVHERAPIDIILRNLSEVPSQGVVLDSHPLPTQAARLAAMSKDHRQALSFERNRPIGLAASAMDTAQRSFLDDLVDVYLRRLPEPLAERERIRKEAAGIDGMFFAWAGSEGPGDPHYYRIHGPTLLIEYDNAQDDANHVHSVWRDPDRDFGRHVLRRHRVDHH